MTHDELVADVVRVGFADPDSITSLVREAVSLRVGEEDATPLGSRLGGLPAMPMSMAWPGRDGRTLAFIAQIDLAVQPRVVGSGLPEQGLLLFFYDAEQTTWGFDPKDQGSFAVYYVPDASAGTEMPGWPVDLPQHARYQARPLVSEVIAVLPPWESVLVEDLRLDGEQLNAYQDLLERTSTDDAWASRGLLVGYPDQIQGDMMLECALVAAGLYCGDGKAYQDPRLEEFRTNARGWRLLLQVPSAESAAMMWGDGGCLYYWIQEHDLKARRFERAWVILQCS